MQLCYHKILDSNWGFKTGLRSFAKNQQQALLKQWAKMDTPDNFEIARNECIASIQGSRNPFIDFPSWVDCIDLDDLRLLKTCEGLVVTNPINSLSTAKNTDWDVWYYEHAYKKYTIKLYQDKISPLEIVLYNINGQVIKHEHTRINEGENVIFFDLSNLSNGNYLVMLKSTERAKTLRLLVK